MYEFFTPFTFGLTVAGGVADEAGATLSPPRYRGEV